MDYLGVKGRDKMKILTRQLGVAMCSLASILALLIAMDRSNLVIKITELGGAAAPILMLMLVVAFVVVAFIIVGTWIRAWGIKK